MRVWFTIEYFDLTFFDHEWLPGSSGRFQLGLGTGPSVTPALSAIQFTHDDSGWAGEIWDVQHTFTTSFPIGNLASTPGWTITSSSANSPATITVKAQNAATPRSFALSTPRGTPVGATSPNAAMQASPAFVWNIPSSAYPYWTSMDFDHTVTTTVSMRGTMAGPTPTSCDSTNWVYTATPSPMTRRPEFADFMRNDDSSDSPQERTNIRMQGTFQVPLIG